LSVAVELGLGLIAIGRSWGYRKQPVPDGEQVQAFLSGAVEAGVRFYDTAPSYGTSEERLGRFLSGLPVSARDQLFIATKAGEHWDPETDTLRVDHSYDALKRSVERSLERLGRIHLLQLHKATVATVTSAEVKHVLQGSGVEQIGASVTDWDTAQIVLQDDLFRAIQIPFHLNNRALERVFEQAAVHGKRVLVNRPFGMGELLYDGQADPHQRKVEAFAAIVRQPSDTVVLTGTQSSDHLRENLRAFREACGRMLEYEGGHRAAGSMPAAIRT